MCIDLCVCLMHTSMRATTEGTHAAMGEPTASVQPAWTPFDPTSSLNGLLGIRWAQLRRGYKSALEGVKQAVPIMPYTILPYTSASSSNALFAIRWAQVHPAGGVARGRPGVSIGRSSGLSTLHCTVQCYGPVTDSITWALLCSMVQSWTLHWTLTARGCLAGSQCYGHYCIIIPLRLTMLSFPDGSKPLDEADFPDAGYDDTADYTEPDDKNTAITDEMLGDLHAFDDDIIITIPHTCTTHHPT